MSEYEVVVTQPQKRSIKIKKTTWRGDRTLVSAWFSGGGGNSKSWQSAWRVEPENLPSFSVTTREVNDSDNTKIIEFLEVIAAGILAREE